MSPFTFVFSVLILGFPKAWGIYDGNTTTNKHHPYVVAVECDSGFLCAGTIIGDQWVLYLGDCAIRCSLSSQVVLTHCVDGFDGKKWEIKEIYVHPKFATTYLDYNYALIKTKEKFKWSSTVQKANLPKRQLKAGTEGVIVGYGAPVTNNLPLRDANIKLLSRKQCEKFYKSSHIKLTKRMGCVYSHGMAAPCYDDYGDPLLEGKTIYHMVTYVSYYNICTSDTIPALTADVYPAVKWIKKITNIK